MKYTFGLFAIIAIVFAFQTPELTQSLILNQANAYGMFTYMLAHAGLPHFLLNMLALFVFGKVSEEVLGWKMLALFFISGIVAGLFSTPFYAGVIGASGAIYGLLGFSALLRPERNTWFGIVGIPMPLIIIAVIYAIFDIAGLFFYSGTANITHLSGLIVGVAFAIHYRERASPL